MTFGFLGVSWCLFIVGIFKKWFMFFFKKKIAGPGVLWAYRIEVFVFSGFLVLKRN